jgi:hypothetical protein
MLKKTRTRTLCCLLLLTLASTTLFAQRVAHAVHSKNVIPLKDSPAATVKIFSNLGPTPTNAYDDTNGFFVLGPTNSLGYPEQWIGLPFIPKGSAHVTQLQVAVGYMSGTKQIIVGLYDDNFGTVGNVLASGTATLIPDWGTCCHLVTVNITSTAVTAGTQYWIVVTSDDTNAPDFEGAWGSSNFAKTASNVAIGGWFTISNNWPAGTARGTVP